MAERLVSMLGINALQKSIDDLGRNIDSLTQDILSVAGRGSSSGGGGGSAPTAPSGNGGNWSTTPNGGNQSSSQTGAWAGASQMVSRMGQMAKTAGKIGAYAEAGNLLLGGQKFSGIGSDIVDTQSIFQTYGGGSFSLNQQVSAMGNGLWAANSLNTADRSQAFFTSTSGIGAVGGSSKFNSAMNNASSLALLNPGMGIGQAAGVNASLYSNNTNNMMRLFGVQTRTNTGGMQSPLGIATQILNQVYGAQWKSIKWTADQVAFATGDPSSPLTQSIFNMVQAGALDSTTAGAITNAANGLLKMQASGQNPDTLGKLLNTYSSSSASRAALAKANIGNSDFQTMLNKQGTAMTKDASSAVIDSFNTGLSASTSLIGKFNALLGNLLGNGAIGDTTGGIMGFLHGAGGNAESRMSVGVGGGSSGMGSTISTGIGGGGTSASSGGASSSSGASASASGGGSSKMGYPTTTRKISTPYGVRGPMWKWKGYHTGVDFAVPPGTPVMASADGVVAGVGPSAAGADYGNAVLIDHGGGLQTLYAHNTSTKVTVGSNVAKGALIAYSGATGNVTGPHVHFEVRKGPNNPVNPAPYLGGSMAVPAGTANGASTSGTTGGQGTPGSSGSGTQFSVGGLGGSEVDFLSGVLSSTAGAMGAGAGAGSDGAGGSSVSGPASPIAATGDAAANQKLAQKIIASNPAYRGWNTGTQWQDLVNLWTRESGWSATAVNTSSGAYGIAQILPSAHPGVNLQNDAKGQIEWGLNYVKGRYKDPAGAWAHETGIGWYDKGSWELKRDELAMVHKGEMIIPAKEAEAIRKVLDKGSSGGGGIVFQPGAIQLVVGQGATITQAQSVGRGFVEAVIQDDRIKTLQKGL